MGFRKCTCSKKKREKKGKDVYTSLLRCSARSLQLKFTLSQNKRKKKSLLHIWKACVLLHLWLSDFSEVVCQENQLVQVGWEKCAPWFIGNETRLWKYPLWWHGGRGDAVKSPSCSWQLWRSILVILPSFQGASVALSEVLQIGLHLTHLILFLLIFITGQQQLAITVSCFGAVGPGSTVSLSSWKDLSVRM